MKNKSILSKWGCVAICGLLVFGLFAHKTGGSNVVSGIIGIIQTVFSVTAFLGSVALATYFQTRAVEKYTLRHHPGIEATQDFFPYICHGGANVSWVMMLWGNYQRQQYDNLTTLVFAILIAIICASCMIRHIRFNETAIYDAILSLAHVFYVMALVFTLAPTAKALGQ